MKRSKTLVVCAMLGGSIMFSSCIGSFGLWNNLKDWNQGVSNKFVNELIFVAFHIVPVYEIAYLADALVLNSIEFWSGSNPTASIGEVKEVKGENGEYLVKTNTDGYTITKKGEEKSVDLVYNKDNNTWNAVADGQSFELVKMNEDGTATVSMQNGTCLSATNAENQQIAKQTPSFTPKNVKSSVFVLFKIIQPLHNKRVAILKESDEKRLIFIYPFSLIFQDFTSS